MGETHEDDLVDDQQPSRPLVDLPGAWSIVLGVLGAATLIAWANVIFQGFKQPAHVDDIANDWWRDPSAIQISQVADQAMTRMIGHISVAAGATGVFLVLLVFALLFSAER